MRKGNHTQMIPNGYVSAIFRSEPNGSLVASCSWDIWDFARVECCLRLRPGVVLPFFKEIAIFRLVSYYNPPDIIRYVQSHVQCR